MTGTDFYVSGGALSGDALSYVRRDADEQLYTALLAGRFCYVLTPRQMGKSSLMAHTAARLRDAGVTVGVIDLSGLGYNLDAEQWYYGLLDRLGTALHLEDEIEAFDLGHERLSPLQRWQHALRDVALERTGGQVVIFLDEIDIVRSLPFSTDEFFAAIRACFNARTEDPHYLRLTFCLLGVATPTDLIRNPRLTPFNIGTRIELHDFTLTEVSQLQAGLGHDHQANRRLMARIYYWTGGHPYLTQRLCRAVADEVTAVTESGVDRLCRSLFVASANRDDNLLFVQQRLLPEPEEERSGPQQATRGMDRATRSEVDEERIGLLMLYRQALTGGVILDNETAPLVGQLKLSGAVRVEKGVLRVRNRLYARVFDRAWVAAHLPDAGLRRQKSAYRRGLVRATAFASVVLGVIGALAGVALVQARIARSASARAQLHEQHARQALLVADRNLYIADMNVAQRAWEDGDTHRTATLVAAHIPFPADAPPAFEWRYLWSALHQDTATLHGHSGLINCVAYSPNGALLASGSFDNTVRLWNARSHRLETRFDFRSVVCLAFTPDGRTLAAGSTEGAVRLWDVASRQQLPAPPAHKGELRCLAVAPNSRELAVGYADGTLLRWDLSTHRLLTTLHKPGLFGYGMVFHADANSLIAAKADKTIQLLDLQTGQETPLGYQSDNTSVLALSPDGNTLISGGMQGLLSVWDVRSRRLRFRLPGHQTWINALAFSPDGKAFASASWDYTARLWDLTRRTYVALKGHTDRVNAVAFSADSAMLATGSSDKTVKIWKVAHREQDSLLIPASEHVAQLTAVSRSNDILAIRNSQHADSITLWNLKTRSALRTLRYADRAVMGLGIAPDGSQLAVSYENGAVALWDTRTGRRHLLITSSPHVTNGLAFSAAGRALATVNQNGDITVWSPATKRNPTHLKTSAHPAQRIALSPDGTLVAVASGNHGDIGVWNLLTNNRIDRAFMRGQHTDVVSQITFSPDGHLLASSGWEGRLALWDLDSRKPIATLPAHKGSINAVVFSQDGKTLATGGADGVVKLWNLEKQREVAIFHNHRRPIAFLAFTGKDESTMLVSCSEDQVQLWQAASWREIKAHTSQEK